MRVLAVVLPLLLACGSDEPVLSGVAPPVPIPSIEAAEGTAEAAPADGAEAAPDGPTVYQRAEGVYVDARYLGGKRYREVRDEVAAQLGALQSAEDLPGDNGREMVFERGNLRLIDDQIILVEVPLPTPLRRTEALAILGFPPATGRYLILHREFRLNHVWGFRRLRMMRENRNSENVIRVQAWYRVPGDHDEQR